MLRLGKLVHFPVFVFGCIDALSMVAYRVVKHDCFMILVFTCDTMLLLFILNNDKRPLQFDNFLNYNDLITMHTIMAES
jgi:hypothetical protein